MKADQLQETIVQSILEFLNRAELAMETLPIKQKPGTRHMTMRFLHEHLRGEVGPTARFRLLPAWED